MSTETFNLIAILMIGIIFIVSIFTMVRVAVREQF